MSAQKIASDRKRSRPVEKRSAMSSFKGNKFWMVLILIIVVVAVATAYYFVISGEDNTEDQTGNPIAVINTSMGIIRVELYEDKAPNTCENFIKYVNDGFYSGLVFHRMANLNQSAPGTHIVQGGGFDGNGNYQEPTYAAIDLEIAPDLTHVDGVVAMARTNDPNSATSQFYICDGPQHDLDDEFRQTNYGLRGYAVFGQVVDEESMDVVRAICALDTITKEVPAPYYTLDNWPLDNGEDVVITSITIQ